jgi:hypothetical protein
MAAFDPEQVLVQLVSVLFWIERSAVGGWVRESIWAFPSVLVFHTLGLGVAAGFGVAVNLWTVALASRYPGAPLKPFFAIAWAGFGVSLASGLLLIAAYPAKALTDPVFYLKLTLVAGALTQLEWLRRRHFAQVNAPLQPTVFTRAMAVAAIAAWASAVLTGRLLAYTFNYFWAAELPLGH